jgi:hypothetical protein
MHTAQGEPAMSTKATSILRSAAPPGVAVAALAMAPMATAIDQGFAPRPDFPGAKQVENPAGKQTTAPPRSTSKSNFKKQRATVSF